jgi:hypothetical protein
MVGDAPFGGFAEVVPQVPAVRDLHCLRCPVGGAFSEERSSVPADDLDPWPLGQPGGQARCLPVWQQVHRPSSFNVDQHRAVVPAFARRVLIDADHSRGWQIRFGQRLDEPQHRAAADGHPKDSSHPSSRPAGQGEADCRQRRTQTLGPPAVSPGQSRHLLNERPSPARSDGAGEATDPKAKHHLAPCAGHIRRKPQVGAMNPDRPVPAARTR